MFLSPARKITYICHSISRGHQVKKATLISVLFLILGCSGPDGAWNRDEVALIMKGNQTMRVTLVTDDDDLAVLRRPSADIPAACVGGRTYEKLAGRMVATVVAEDGVGIAGPQVGLSRRIVAVQRFDKEGEPFEVYPNIHITETRGDLEPGPEGCLSVPDCRGEVLRFRDIEIAYTSPKTLSDTTEHITGFTAVIFQHECDHLDGILFTDRINTDGLSPR